MKYFFERIFAFCLLLLFQTACCSQKQIAKPIAIGDKVPMAIWKTISKGKNTKLIILDFWATSCSSCMHAFKEVEELQNEFPNELQFVLVNSWETKQEIQSSLSEINKRRRKNGYDTIALPKAKMINHDSVFIKLFPALSVPQHVWIDRNGIVKAITYGYNATTEHIQAILRGEKLNMLTKNDIAQEHMREKGLLTASDPKMIFYYSSLAPYYSGGAGSSQYIDTIRNLSRRTEFNNDIITLFKIAFNRSNVLLESKDPEKYVRPTNGNLIDSWTKKYCFSYEVQAPLKDINNWQPGMQTDLNKYFGDLLGIEGKTEKRKVQSLVLVKTKDGLLKSSNADPIYFSSDTMINIVNQSFSSLTWLLKVNLENGDFGKVFFFDETGLDQDSNIDVRLTGNLKSVDSLRTQLAQYGLDILLTTREAEVLVLKDKGTVNGK